MYPIRVLFLFVVSLASLVADAAFNDAWATRVEGLYESTQQVSDQQAEERTRALRAALAEVFVRVSGRSDAPRDENLIAALNNAVNYALQYRYERVSGADGGQALVMRIRFDPTSVDALLRSSSVPVWGRERPATLVWLAVDDGGRRVVSAEEEQGLAKALRQVAERRGLPVLMPLMDLEDRRSVSFSDLWGGFSDRVGAASQRYATEQVLLVRLSRSASGGWQGRFSRKAAGQQQVWEQAGGTAEDALSRGLEVFADDLAAEYATVSSGIAFVTLGVDGVTNLRDYGRVMAYLSGLSAVNGVGLTQVGPDAVLLSVQVRGDAPLLFKVIGLGNVLAAATEADSGVPRFSLLPY
ncbi:MAG: DUF2066 domain-containing protein [Gammaproteobacteria bacterium]